MSTGVTNRVKDSVNILREKSKCATPVDHCVWACVVALIGPWAAVYGQELGPTTRRIDVVAPAESISKEPTNRHSKLPPNVLVVRSASVENPTKQTVTIPRPRFVQLEPVETVAATEQVLDTAPQSSVVSSTGNLDSILDLAFSTHPELTRAMAVIDRESGNRYQATRWPNPVVGYVGSEVGQEGRAGQQGIFWSQEWITAGKLSLADQIGQWRVVAAEAALEVDRLRLSRRVQSQYWSLVAARQRVTVLTQLESLLAEAVAINEKLFEAAEVSKGTVLQARLEQSQVVIARQQAVIDAVAKTRMLAQTLSIADEQVDAFGNDPWPSNFSHDSTTIQVSSPELAAARALCESGMCELRRAEVEIVPNVNTQATVQQDAISRNTIVGIQVGVALPITDRKTGLVQAARGEVARLQADLAAIERLVTARVAEAMGQYEAARAMTQQVDSTLLAMSQERLKLAQQAHQQGEIDYLELLTAQRSYLTIQQTAIDAQERAAQAFVRLETMVVEE